MDIYNCYIDESGCEGFNKNSTDWFLLSAVIVNSINDRSVGEAVQEFIDEYYVAHNRTEPLSGVHWRSLSDNQKKKYISNISTKNFCQIIIAINKGKLDRAHYINHSGALYRYTFKLLIERISWYVGRRDGWAKIVCSEGTSIKINEMRAYIASEMSIRNTRIKKVLDPTKFKTSTMKKNIMLRVADACVSAYGNAFNKGSRNRRNPYYANEIAEKLYRYNGNIIKYGLKIFPLEDNISSLFDEYPFIKDWMKLKT